ITKRATLVKGPINAVVIYKVVPMKKFYAKFKGVMSAIVAAPGLVKEQIPVMLYDGPGNVNIAPLIAGWKAASGKTKPSRRERDKAPLRKPTFVPDYHHLGGTPSPKHMGEIRQYLSKGTISDSPTPGTTLIVTRSASALPESCGYPTRNNPAPYVHLVIPPAIKSDNGYEFGASLFKGYRVVFQGGVDTSVRRATEKHEQRAKKEEREREREREKEKKRELAEERESKEKLLATRPDPTTIHWTHGGEDVRLAGGFNQWSPEGLAMDRDEGGHSW
ncbi:hypothetical protein KIPB_010972, partial [Kipferlia bialata]